MARTVSGRARALAQLPTHPDVGVGDSVYVGTCEPCPIPATARGSVLLLLPTLPASCPCWTKAGDLVQSSWRSLRIRQERMEPLSPPDPEAGGATWGLVTQSRNRTVPRIGPPGRGFLT
jgi:hypothetical protein